MHEGRGGILAHTTNYDGASREPHERERELLLLKAETPECGMMF